MHVFIATDMFFLSIPCICLNAFLNSGDTKPEDRNQSIDMMFTVIVCIICIIIFAFSFKASDMLLSYVFKDKPRQEFCGVFKQEFSIGQGKGKRTYWVIENSQTQQTINFPKNRDFFHDFYRYGDKICIIYAIDERWLDVPYIYSFSKDFSNQ